MAVDGYWRNWERTTAWLMREVVFAMIAGNPNIKKDSKPSSSREIFKIRDDKTERRDKIEKKISPEELEEIKKKLIAFRDGTSK
jgi:hypothetical protein